MLTEMPYFMKNEEWYYHDEAEFKYKLTDKAPPEAVKSYEEFYAVEIFIDKDGKEWIVE